MDKFIVEGGEKLKGKVSISGAKNAALPIIAASILADNKVILKNIPHLRDVETMIKVLKFLGVKVKFGNHRIEIEPESLNNYKAPYDLIKTMRASIYVMGSLLAKQKRAEVSHPGGCSIGARPINLHLKGFKELGAKVSLEHGYIKAKVNKLKGADIYLDTISVGATANIMMAACLAAGTTFIRNAACEPHIVDLGNFLISMGAKITGLGTNCIKIKGVSSLKGTTYTISNDYIEAGTFLLASAITKGKIIIENVPVRDIEAILKKIKETGMSITRKDNLLTAKCSSSPRAVDIITAPYPGFPTDMQAQWMAFMSVAKGSSVITETIWENRFMHVAELIRMGADITVDGNKAVIKGVPELSGAKVMVSDLRAGASLVLASLVAKGRTDISRVYHLDRGYERIEEKLSALGAKIKRIRD